SARAKRGTPAANGRPDACTPRACARPARAGMRGRGADRPRRPRLARLDFGTARRALARPRARAGTAAGGRVADRDRGARERRHGDVAHARGRRRALPLVPLAGRARPRDRVGRNPGFPHPLVCPSLLSPLEPNTTVAGLPAWRPEGGEPWMYDARIEVRVTLRSRSGRRPA